MMIKLVKSSFYHEQETKEALAQFILNESILSMGQQCRQFENSFAMKQNRTNAVYVSNGSVANLLVIQAMLNLGRLNKGDRIGFSALTWPTNVMPLIQLGLVPVALDCNLKILNVSPQSLEKYASSLKGLFLTNVLGFCDDIESIKEICLRESVVLIEDNCESLGSKVKDTLLGNFGIASTFSFFVGHHMSTIEGGMVCTDDNELNDALRMARAHGWDRNLEADKQAELRLKNNLDSFYAKYAFYDLASNFRPTEINGFIGNQQIKYWDEIVSRRASNFGRFMEKVNLNDDFYSYDMSHMSVVSNFSMPVICKTVELARLYRSRFQHAEVEIRPVIAGNVTKQPFYAKYVKDIQPCPNSDLTHDNGFYFGNNPEMSDQDLEILCKLLEK